MPYGIVATRSFQPDAPMTLCTLIAALAVARYFESPVTRASSPPRCSSGLATVVKPMSVFLTLPALIGMALARQPWSQLVVNRRFALLVLLAFLPATLYYGYGAVFGTLARDQMRMRFVPALLPTQLLLARLADADPPGVRPAAVRAGGPRRASSRRGPAPGR